ncbi:MAG: DUF3017 domain-containing protein [Actinomycetota bacterium]|nr:DUF3017 domain-containing protein [Actinomycetota bacterium]
MVPLPRSRGSQLYLLQLLVVATGLVLVMFGVWRTGLHVIGAAFVGGAIARAIVPVEHEGMLHVRSKPFDIFWMTTLGVALITLAIAVPPPPG